MENLISPIELFSVSSSCTSKSEFVLFFSKIYKICFSSNIIARFKGNFWEKRYFREKKNILALKTKNSKLNKLNRRHTFFQIKP